MVVPTNERKEKIEKYNKLKIKNRDLVMSITKILADYDKTI